MEVDSVRPGVSGFWAGSVGVVVSGCVCRRGQKPLRSRWHWVQMWSQRSGPTCLIRCHRQRAEQALLSAESVAESAVSLLSLVRAAGRRTWVPLLLLRGCQRHIFGCRTATRLAGSQQGRLGEWSPRHSPLRGWGHRVGVGRSQHRVLQCRIQIRDEARIASRSSAVSRQYLYRGRSTNL